MDYIQPMRTNSDIPHASAHPLKQKLHIKVTFVKEIKKAWPQLLQEKARIFYVLYSFTKEKIAKKDDLFIQKLE